MVPVFMFVCIQVFKLECISRFGSNAAPTSDLKGPNEDKEIEEDTIMYDDDFLKIPERSSGGISDAHEQISEETDDIPDLPGLKREQTTVISQTVESCKCFIGQIVVEVIQTHAYELPVDVIFVAERGNKTIPFKIILF